MKMWVRVMRMTGRLRWGGFSSTKVQMLTHLLVKKIELGESGVRLNFLALLVTLLVHKYKY